MSGYGLQIKNSAGTITLDITDVITRLAYTNDVGSGETGNSGALSQLSGKSSVQFAIVQTGLPHKVTRSDNTIYWVPNKNGAAASRILCFIYD